MLYLLNKFKRTILLIKALFIELIFNPIVIKASVSIGYNGKPIHCNWGDDINFWFLKEISRQPILMYNQSVLTRLFRRKYVLGIGSIIGMLSDNNSIIWGSGIFDSTTKNILPPAEIRAVRGPYTRQKLISFGIECPEIYGDPALLISKYYNPNIKKKYKVGIIPQYSQRQQEDAQKAFGNENNIHYIQIAKYDDWHNFIDEILRCEIIVSSSLHGLIIAESYRIPSVWVEFPTNFAVNRIKYKDFYASIGKDCNPLVINGETCIDQVIKRASDWVPGEIDLQPLIDACPFKLKI